MRRYLLSACVVLGFAGSLAAADFPVPAPMAMPEESAYLVAVVPDLLATLGRIEAIAGVFAPGQMLPGALKNQLGAMLGDPGLANLVNKPLVVVVGPGAPTPSFALLVPAKNPQAYLDAGVNFGMLLGKTVDGLAVMTQTPDGEILGEKIAKVYPAMIQNVPKGDIRLLVSPDKLMQTYGGMLGMMAQMAAGQAGNQGGPATAKILGLEIAGLMAMTAELLTVQIDLRLDPVAIGEEITIAAKPGSGLAKALAAPAPAVGQRAAARMGNEPGIMAMSGRMNIQAFSSYVAKVMGDLKAKPEAQGVITDDLIAAIEQWGSGLTGDSAFRLRAVEGAMPMSWEGLYAANDQAKFEASIENMVKLFAGEGPLGELYRDMGLTMTLPRAHAPVPPASPSTASTSRWTRPRCRPSRSSR
jgi:hypothetical protein